MKSVAKIVARRLYVQGNSEPTSSIMQSISTDGHLTAGAIAARLDRLPQTFTVWKLIILLSLGFFFELYDLLFTGNIAPGLVKSGILTPTTPGLFGSTGVASFVAALFAGLFIGAIACGFLADKYGRRAIFTYSLLWYTATNVLMAFPEHSLRAQPLALPVWHRHRGRTCRYNLPGGELLWLPQLGADLTDQAGHHDHQHPVLYHPDRIGRTDRAVARFTDRRPVRAQTRSR